MRPTLEFESLPRVAPLPRKGLRTFGLALLAAPLLFLSACSEQVAGDLEPSPDVLQGRLTIPGTTDPATHVSVVLESLSVASPRAPAESAWVPIDTSASRADGAFCFPLRSHGVYRLVARVGDSLILSKVLDWSSSDPPPYLDLALALPSGRSLLVDDFESEDSTQAISRWYHDAYRWSTLEADPKAMQILPETVVEDPQSGIVPCGEHGRCFQVQASVRDSQQSAPTEFYTMFRPAEGDGFDLRTVDSLEVFAQGHGTLLLSIWARDIDSSADSWSILTRQYPLTDGWSRLVLPTRMLLFGDDSLPWHRTFVHKITFGLTGCGTLRIDDIRLHGATILDLQTR